MGLDWSIWADTLWKWIGDRWSIHWSQCWPNFGL